MLKIQALKKAYDEEIILEIPEFQIGNGIYWIQGENGAGKTTFLKILAGIIPYEGTIQIDGVGEEKKNRNPYRKKVNFAEAEPLFPDFLNGNELIRFYEKVKGENSYSRNLIQSFGILEYSSKTLKTYSSGMLKKLSLVLGLIGEPSLILLDEPLITLDSQAVNHLLEILNQWIKFNPELIILFTSHQSPDLNQFPINGILRLENQTLVSLK